MKKTNLVTLYVDSEIEPLDQKGLPALPLGENKQLHIPGSKWYHAEEEWIVSLLADLALKRGEWYMVSFDELLKAARHSRYDFAIGNKIQFTIALYNVAATRDIQLVGIDDHWLIFPRAKLYVVPLPELCRTIADCGGGWIPVE
jgi:hypothetical protein